MSSSTLATAENRELAAALARLDALTDWERRPRGAMRVGLESMRDLTGRLGNPQTAFRSIHVAGTKGKGSVSALIEAGLSRAGMNVGRYASPHVEHVTERVSVQGRMIDEVTLAHGLNRALDAYEAARRAKTEGANATWFDIVTCAAFLIFREAGVEWAAVEVGLGGRLDSTNIVNGEIAVVTNIELEHTEILGASRQAIAREKVGILKPGAVLLTTLGPDDQAGRTLQAKADELACPVLRARLPATATIEETNAALAGLALDQLGRSSVRARARPAALSDAPVGAWLLDAATCAAARLPGRMERFEIDVGSSSLTVVLDGAHVPFNLAAVLRDLSRAPGLAGPCAAVVALAADKDARGFVEELGRRASIIVFTDLPGSSRGRSPADLRTLATSLGVESEVEPALGEAFRRGVELGADAGAWLLVTGSLYLVGALRAEISATSRTPLVRNTGKLRAGWV